MSSNYAHSNLRPPSSQTRAVIPVSGLKDPVMTALRRVKTHGGRLKEGLYLAEGFDLSGRAVRYGAEVVAWICVEGQVKSAAARALIELLPSSVTLHSCSEGLLNKCLEAKPTPPCVALVRRVEEVWNPRATQGGTGFDTTNISRPALWLGVDHGDSADNLGMLLRSAEAAGVSGALLSGGTVDPWGRKVVRAARGAMFGLPLALHDSSLDAVLRAQSAGLSVVSTSAKAMLRYDEVDYTQPTLILVGNEHHGIAEDVVERSDRLVKIPMLGHIHSLNIAVAASLMLFEAQRQRGWRGARDGRAHVD